MFQFLLSEIEQTVFLEGNATFSGPLASEIENRYDLFVDGNLINYTIGSSENQSLLIRIESNNSFELNSVKFAQKQNFNTSNNISVFVSVASPPPTKKYFFHLK